MQFPHRYIARIIVEAETPLAIGSDNQQEDQDNPVTKDFNGLPYIPGTALAGWLRKHNDETDFFGDKPENKASQGNGSNIIISDAYLLDDKKKVYQQMKSLRTDAFLSKFYDLPIRQHVAIDYKGTAKDGSLFDREIVYKGSRFKFEIALELEEQNDEAWNTLLNSLYSDDFYIGGGQFDGFGNLKVVDIQYKYFYLKDDLDDYLEIDVDLNKPISDATNFEKINNKPKPIYDEKLCELTGENSFHHFGAGYGDTEVDHVNYKEEIILWKDEQDSNIDWTYDNDYKFKTMFVIPATSIKGALTHRTAFYYNKDEGNTVEAVLEKYFNKALQMQPAETLEELLKQEVYLEKYKEVLQKTNISKIYNSVLSENNTAVQELFGMAKNSNNNNGQSGKVIIHDVFLDAKEYKEHIFYHNKIDRFTGGTVDGALYSEKVIHINKTIDLIIKIRKDTDKTYLNKAIHDLTNGMLPAGGLVNKGHGFFNIKTENHE